METFEKLLDEYKSNYVQFLTTGAQEYKRAYSLAQSNIEDMLQEKQALVDKEKSDMKHFAGSYKQDNDTISDLYDTSYTMFKDAQKIQDSYETAKDRYDAKVDPPKSIDFSTGYAILMRIGILLITVPVFFAIAYFMPSKVTGYNTG
jgi:hypothetical protein